MAQGTLPMLNQEAVNLAVKAGIALNANIASRCAQQLPGPSLVLMAAHEPAVMRAGTTGVC